MSSASPPPAPPRHPAGSDEIPSPAPAPAPAPRIPSLSQATATQLPIIRPAVGFQQSAPFHAPSIYGSNPPPVSSRFRLNPATEPIQWGREKPKKAPKGRGTGPKPRKARTKEQVLDCPKGGRAFRVESYPSEPSNTSRLPQSGPYGSDYRAEQPPRPVVLPSGNAHGNGREESSAPSNALSQTRQASESSQHFDDYQGHSDGGDYDLPDPDFDHSPAHSNHTERQGPIRDHDDYHSHAYSQRQHEASDYSRSRPQPSMKPTSRAGPSRVPTRILTLLIRDIRPGQEEDQLAEVKVPLKQAEYAEDGFWVDAKDVCDILQESPSRIDGPAKVYATRGRYKQCFLRVTEDGIDQCTSTNLKVHPDRTLDVEVHDNPTGRFKSRSLSSRVSRMIAPGANVALPPITVVAPQPVAPVDVEMFTPDRFDHERPPSALSRKRGRSITPRSPIPEAYNPRRYQEPEEPRYRQFHPSTAIYQRQLNSHNESMAPREMSTSLQRNPSGDTGVSHRSFSSNGAHFPPQSQTFQKSRRSPIARVQPHPEQRPRSRDFSPAVSVSSGERSPPLPGPSASKKTRYSSRSPDRDSHGWNDNPAPNTPLASTSTVPPDPPAAGFESYNQARNASGLGQYSQNQPASRLSPQPSSTSSIHSSNSSEEPNQDALDNKVGVYLREAFKAEPGWDDFVEARKQKLPMSAWLRHYRYVQDKLEEYLGKYTGPKFNHSTRIQITKEQILKAFNLSLSWIEEGTEILTLHSMYGPEGTRFRDSEVLEAFYAPPPISTGLQAKRYLQVLRGVHARSAIPSP